MKIRVMCVALAASAGAAFGQLVAPPPAPEKAEQPAAAQPAGSEPTLIKHDEKGRLIRPDAPADEAALDMVGLDAGERAAVDAVLAQRFAVIDGIVSENLPRLLKLQGVQRGDSEKERLQAIKEMFQAFQPVRDMGQLRQVAATMMAPEKAAKYNQLLNDYWQALFQEATLTQKIRGKTPTESEIRGRETLLVTGIEILRSYDRQIKAKAPKLDDMLAKAKATPEQMAKIKPLEEEFRAKDPTQLTGIQYRQFFNSVLKQLNDDQMLGMLEALYADAKGSPAGHGGAKPVDEKPAPTSGDAKSDGKK
jgi:hypothetical protein